ncbi:hypothetical protein CVS40_5780 [Lucilia cuprina]|nr:hypothetical protein CVS40_5780 [Lucilia cuprina]
MLWVVILVSEFILNDHFSPAAGKLNGICKKLLGRKIISKYRILNNDILRAKLTMSDGKELVLDYSGCAGLLVDASYV